MLAGAVLAVAAATTGYLTLRPRQDPFGGGLMCHSGRCCKVCPADFAKGDVIGNRPVLNPLMFVGTARQAYIVAQQNPSLLAQLWCYCGCDRTNGHRCFLIAIETITVRLAQSVQTRHSRPISFSIRGPRLSKSGRRYGCASRGMNETLLKGG
jgi:hypothetical protein